VIELASHTEGAPSARLVVLLHGILGSERNWRSFARAFCRVRPDLRLWTPDLRGHGSSPAGEAPHSIDACVADLAYALAAQGDEPVTVIGHSFGGKVALQLGAVLRVPPQVWVLDSDPRPRVRDGGSQVLAVIERARRVPMPVANREQALAPFADLGPSIQGWMSTNLKRGEGGLRWRFDLDVVMALLADFGARDATLLLPSLSGRVHFVWGESGVLPTGPSLPSLQAAQHHMLRGAGHWVHVDRGDLLLELLSAGIPRVG